MTRFHNAFLTIGMLAALSTQARAGEKKPVSAAAPPRVEVMAWSSTSWIPGMFCTKFDVPTDPDGWDDNFLCSSRDLKLQWSNHGPLGGMACTQIYEGSDPDGWGNNYLCSPRDYGFKWSFDHAVAGMQCLQITEPKDPHTWNDNYLCWPRAGAGPMNAMPIPAQNQTDVLNLIRTKYDYQSYLEIGQGKREDNFDAIDAKVKIGVDPNRQWNAAFQMTPDEFFAQNKMAFDLIFIHGLHDAGKVEKTLSQSLKILKKDGTIVISDCNPTTDEQQKLPAPPTAGEWYGDVWKAWVKLRATRDDLNMYVVNLDTGCGVITRGKQKKLTLPANLNYEALAANRKDLLNLIDVKQFDKEMTGW